MEFPPAWEFFPIDDFEIAVPRDPGELGLELMAQVRINGRMLDHFRIAVGGSLMLEARVKLSDVLPINDLPNWFVNFSTWPRDIMLRRNMVTSTWLDMKDQLASNDVKLTDENSLPVEHALLLELMENATDKLTNSTVTRWSVNVGDDGHLKLQLQAIPSTATSYASKPLWKG